MYNKKINNITYSTRSQNIGIANQFAVYKTTFKVNNEIFTYYGKQSFDKNPDMQYIGSGRRVKEKLAEASDKDSIVKIVLGVFDDEAAAFDFESKSIKGARKRKENLLNLRCIKSGGNIMSKLTPEQIKERNAKISASMKGHAVTQSTKDKISEANTGNVHSQETRELISLNRKGKGTDMKSEETKAKMSAAHKARWAIRKAQANQGS